MRIFFATRVRGFFRHLFADKHIDAEFLFHDTNTYEVNSKTHEWLSRCVRSEIGNLLGIIQSIKCTKTGCEIHGSYNRFLDSDKPYFIYVENPTALYHYCLGRNKSFLGAKRIHKKLFAPNLRALVFMSKACEKTFEVVCGKVSSDCTKAQIYPLIPKNQYVSIQQIKSKRQRATVKLLYIAQGSRFLSKGALEIIESYKMLKLEADCSLTMVTNISQIDSKIASDIYRTDGIQLLDFSFSYSDMERLYADHDILLQPTSDDSFGLTILEALHAGLAIVASRLYAIPEIVEEGENGCLIDPAYWFFDKNNIPNPAVWNNRKETIYSGKCVEFVKADLYNCLKRLLANRDLIEQMSLNSYNRAQKEPFCQNYIINQWNDLLASMKKQ